MKCLKTYWSFKMPLSILVLVFTCFWTISKCEHEQPPLTASQAEIGTTEMPMETTTTSPSVNLHTLDLEPEPIQITPGSDKVFNRFPTIVMNCPDPNDPQKSLNLLDTLTALNLHRLKYWSPPISLWLRITSKTNLTSCLTFATNSQLPITGLLSTSANLLPLTFSTLPQNPIQSSCHPSFKNFTILTQTIQKFHLKHGLLLLDSNQCSSYIDFLPESISNQFTNLFFYPDQNLLKTFWNNLPSYLPQYQVAPIIPSDQISSLTNSCAKFTQNLE